MGEVYGNVYSHKRKRYHCGSFRDEKEAALAYNKKVVEILGDDVDPSYLNDVPWDYVAPKDLHKRNTYGYRGVSFHKKTGKWVVTISHNHKSIHCGSFVDIKEAALVYNVKAIELKGDIVKLNTFD